LKSQRVEMTERRVDDVVLDRVKQRRDGYPSDMASRDVASLSSSESVTAVELRYRRGWRCEFAARSKAPRFTPRYMVKSSAAIPRPL